MSSIRRTISGWWANTWRWPIERWRRLFDDQMSRRHFVVTSMIAIHKQLARSADFVRPETPESLKLVEYHQTQMVEYQVELQRLMNTMSLRLSSEIVKHELSKE